MVNLAICRALINQGRKVEGKANLMHVSILGHVARDVVPSPDVAK